METILRFGIPSLDQLWGSPGDGLPHGFRAHGSTSLCIMGGDGVGKSVIGLHLASRYLADYSEVDGYRPPGVIYAASDLSHEVAETMWTSFRLDQPSERRVCYCEEGNLHRPEWKDQWVSKLYGRRVELESCSVPQDDRTRASGKTTAKADSGDHPDTSGCKKCLAELCRGESKGDPCVYFLDLASKTAGDDWGYLSRFLAALRQPEVGAPLHLLIVDSVEGLETFVGETDFFGEARERRSRIAQVLRTAKDKCHVAFLIEEPPNGARSPEEYVTDAVVRLSSDCSHGYTSRTVEIEKARGQTQIRGRHPFVIRDGRGSKSEKQANPDDPTFRVSRGLTQGYVHVFPSLHCLQRSVLSSTQRTKEDWKDRRAGFGITYLDNMLDRGNSEVGLPLGTMTALIGEDGTRKARLGRAFLAQCFAQDKPPSVAVLLTTHTISGTKLLGSMAAHLKEKHSDITPLSARLIYRMLEPHHCSPEALTHIVRLAVRKAHAILSLLIAGETPDDLAVDNRMRTLTDGKDGDVERNLVAGGTIRLVIDNWSTIMAAYPQVAADPLFLPFLHDFLEEQGVTTLVIDTETGNPAQVRDQRERLLRAIAEQAIYTWRVPFMGESRIAITVLPPVGNKRHAVIRELGVVESDEETPKAHETLEVDPHFELYSGLDKAEDVDPRPVPLKVHLYSESTTESAYHAQIRKWLNGIFQAGDDKDIVALDTSAGYGDLRDLCQIQGDTRLDHSLVLQVDEFWSDVRTGLREQKTYLQGETTTEDGKRLKFEDPHGVFQPRASASDGPKEDGQRSRVNFFNVRGHDYDKYWSEEEPEKEQVKVDRVPYTWDFGFLLCNRWAWEAAFSDRIIVDYARVPKRELTVKQIWDGLCKCGGNSSRKRPVSWREFFRACQQVAAHGPAGTIGYSFDVSMLAPETLSCLVLEVWASQILETNKVAPGNTPPFGNERHSTCPLGLSDYLGNPGGPKDYTEELFLAWVLLGEVFSSVQFESDSLVFRSRPADMKAAAVRHWYGTAAMVYANADNQTDWVPVRLPGRFSVRGDWFLGVAEGSRSMRLADRAIDLLSTRRGNAERLQHGIGLPVRDFGATRGEQPTELWTPLQCWQKAVGQRPVTYDDILKLASVYPTDGSGQGDHYWIWRSAVKDYDRHNRIWMRWLCRLYSDWGSIIRESFNPGICANSFDAYDGLRKELSGGGIPESTGLRGSYEEFKRRCKELSTLLRGASADRDKQATAD